MTIQQKTFAINSMDRKRDGWFWLVISGIMVLSVYRAGGEEIRKGSSNLLANSSFEQPVKDKEDQALNWDNYQCGYTRTKEKSYATDISGPWSCKITGSGGENEKGLGGANTFIRSGLPEHGTFTATINLYVVPGTRGEISDVYITVWYTDKTSQIFQHALTPEQVTANLGKWKTYSLTFSTAPDKKIDYIVYWCIVQSTDEGKFTGTVYFDNAELTLVDKRAKADPPLPFLSVNRAGIPPKIDGRSDDECWQENLELAPFLLISGKGLAAQQTKAYLTYDQKNIYIFMNCFESVLNPSLQKTSEFKAEKTEHDSNVYEDDCVEIFIRPPGKEFYYHLAVNSKGTVYDAKCFLTLDFDKGWDSQAAVKTMITDNSWSAEISIPYQSLETTAPGTEDVWRINLCREEKAFGENSSWSSMKSGFHEPDRFGEVAFGNNNLGSSLLSVGARQKGENYLQVSVFNGGGETQPVIVKTLTQATNPDPSVEKADYRIGSGKKETVKVPYTVAAGSRSIAYQLWQGADLLYASPNMPIQAQTIFMVKTSTGSSGYSIKPLTDFYLVEGELLYLPLVLLANTGKDDVKECRAILEVPYFLRLISPLNQNKDRPPDTVRLGPFSFTEKELIRDGIRYRQYTLNFKPDSLTFPEAASKSDFAINPLLFKSEFLKTRPESAQKYKIYYQAFLNFFKFLKTRPESAQTFKYKIYYQTFLNNRERISGNAGLTLLAPFTQKRPESTVICNWADWVTYYRAFYLLGKEEQAEIVNSWIRAGFNMNTYNPATEELVKNNPWVTNFELWPSLEWMSRQTAAVGKYLSEHPEERTVTQNGQVLADVPSPASVLQPGSPVWDMLLKQMVTRNVINKAQEYARLSYDYEEPVAYPTSIGFDPANLELFRKFAGISQNTLLTPETAVKSYRQQWIDFRCRQNAELIRLLNEGIKKANPKCIFFVYSGYQNSFTEHNYGIKWQYVSPYVDEVWCGYGRPVDEIKNTLKIIGGKPLIGGEIVWMGYGGSYDLDETENNLFRRLTDCGGGFFVYYDWSVDGRFYKAISQVASVAADFEIFFRNFDRDDSLAEVVAGEGKNVAVLKNGPERLLFLFNNNSAPKTFKLKNRDLPPEMVGIDYWGKKAVNLIPILETTVPAYRVTVIYLRNKNSQAPLSAPRIIGETDAKFGGSVPFLAWDSKNSGSAIFELEYSLDSVFPASATKKVDKLTDNYYKIEGTLEENKPYYWRVRTVDLVTNKKSEFSETGSFTK